ncbi:hypothetical protein BH09PSE3_BH09PSE3_26990 [soil metagenome]
MTGTDLMTHSAVFLRPDPSRTVIRPFFAQDQAPFIVEGHTRAQRIVDRVLTLRPKELEQEVDRVVRSLSERHRDVNEMLLRRFSEIEGLNIDPTGLNRNCQLLIGAYFSEEYSFEAAALFNPSMILHPDQSNLPSETIRFAMSLRGIGEGHISSVTFRTGTWSLDGEVVINEPSGTVVSPKVTFTEGEDLDLVTRITYDGANDASESVLFPVTPSQRQGIEDLRMVRFVEDDGEIHYLATYTAFSGMIARSELLRLTDFLSFEMRPLTRLIREARPLALSGVCYGSAD